MVKGWTNLKEIADYIAVFYGSNYTPHLAVKRKYDPSNGSTVQLPLGQKDTWSDQTAHFVGFDMPPSSEHQC
jgi:hypothetical protein